MKRVIKASESKPAKLYVQYISMLDVARNEMGIRSMTVSRPTLKEALVVMLEHIEFVGLDIDYDELDDYSAQDIIDRIMYINGEQPDSDYILYFADKASGQVYIDQNFPEENY